MLKGCQFDFLVIAAEHNSCLPVENWCVVPFYLFLMADKIGDSQIK